MSGSFRQPGSTMGSVAGMRRIPIIFLRRFCGWGGRIPYQLSRPPCSCPRRVSMEGGSQGAASWTSGAGAGAGRMIAPSRRVERVGVPARTRRSEAMGEREGERGDPYGVLLYCVWNRGCREWLAGPPAIHRSSLRDGRVESRPSGSSAFPGACGERGEGG
jgi:hypothetical protein